jgi:hypothetical protein
VLQALLPVIVSKGLVTQAIGLLLALVTDAGSEQANASTTSDADAEKDAGLEASNLLSSQVSGKSRKVAPSSDSAFPNGVL